MAVLAADAVASLFYGDLIWAAFAVAVVAVALAPPLATRDLTVTAAWQALALCAVPMLAQTAGVFVQPMGHVALAALALLVVVELEAFTAIEMPTWFSVLFVALTTISVASLWGILQYYSDVLLETAFLTGLPDLMWDLVGATAIGIAAGVVFELYFSDRSVVDAVEDGVDG